MGEKAPTNEELKGHFKCSGCKNVAVHIHSGLYPKVSSSDLLDQAVFHRAWEQQANSWHFRSSVEIWGNDMLLLFESTKPLE